MLLRKSSKVWTFIAPREYFTCAHWNNLMLRDIVVESKANTSLSMLILGIEVS